MWRGPLRAEERGEAGAGRRLPDLHSEEAVMSDSESVSAWLGRVKVGDGAALEQLWERYYSQLVGLARQRLGGRPPVAADEEDVALSAFNSFFQGCNRGRFPRLDDRDDLWQVLLLLTRQKAANLLQHERRQKRGGGKVRHLSALAEGDSDSAESALELLSTEPTPEFATQVAEECRRLLGALENDELREIAIAKMEGRTNAEIAQHLGRGVSTVERKLGLIRKTWEREVGS
jgi:RNA polymerase sigma factor (sigma-70 family)